MDPWENWLDECNWESNSPCKKLIIIARDKRTKEILGGSLWEYFIQAEAYLYCFLYVAETGRGRGLALQLSLRQWQLAEERDKSGKFPFQNIYCEMHDPR